jgi:sugar phosphate isomerase/epimerase
MRDLLFDAADVLAPAFIKIGSELGPPTPQPEVLVDPLRELAEQAVEHGTRIAIETMPFSIISTVPMGAELISAAGHPAVGLLVDAWHVFRAGTSLDELQAALTPEMIYGVELDDAASTLRGTLFEDTVNNRLLCGEGCFDLRGLVAVLRGRGFDGPWGVEILSSSFRQLPVGQAVKLAAESALAVL